ncbi:MAG: lipoprotein-releasing ABC transporter permease subunit LolE [Paraglaciecola sp.]|uniref:lipoprotein-releasing ABC transporter permease subunit LolE n=1 Tax=Pseudomonadati TaxID=3379134 RepID=UPI00273DDFBB|nr:lipoprotein-releasing ABC transporter permease subunit LolE [Paraglaciecola sp.]MDP5030529.1 lipoprotein-releasing ABC transporter permease subunit LolE [Paraglaciecola sp.]MDP5040026.1 lipoprotein-releasing ABC transporter permease subunit LolE [Paraglaciecola sp.]MDP5129450.1 lipoprotein-releasing ABC transporter permease subunit LolE [Paraglaciecola sp.]
MPLVLSLAWRFRSNKRQNGFISFISASSTVGIGLGCFVLILLLSVMNGFERELQDRLLSIIPHGEYTAVDAEGLANWPEEIRKLSKDSRISFIEPFVKATGMLQKGNELKAVEMSALSPDFAEQNNKVTHVTDEQWHDFLRNENAVLLGQGILAHLNVKVGDKVQLLLPQISEDLSLKAPKSLWLVIAGSLNFAGELSNHIGLMHMSLAADTLGVKNGAQGIRLRFTDPFAAPQIVPELGFKMEPEVYMSDWTRTEGNLYQDIQLVRSVVYIALILVIAVACFNIVSTLVMAVNEKQSEIAMLKSMGAKDSLIIQTFMLQGLLNGAIGTLWGVILGVLMASNLAQVAHFFETLFTIKFLSGDVYFIDFLPSELHWNEVFMTASIALLLSFLATLYPAIKAAKINPAEVLGH